MNAVVSKSAVSGSVIPPPSKSYTIRALFAASMAPGTSRISNPLICEDTCAAMEGLKKLGAVIHPSEDGSLVVEGGNFHAADSPIDCRNSAATLRFFVAMCSKLPFKTRLLAGEGLSKRPIAPLGQAVSSMGAEISYRDNLITITGAQRSPGAIRMSDDQSSQFVSALLLASPLSGTGLSLHLDRPPRSRPYIEMTLKTLSEFGIKADAEGDFTHFEVYRMAYQPAAVRIEADWSSASYLLGLGAVSGNVCVMEVNLDSLQGDLAILKLLKEMGAQIVEEKDSVTVSCSRLRALKTDLAQCIDLLPTMAVLAAMAEGASKFTGIARARLKESNRVEAVKKGLSQMRIGVEEYEDSLIIWGGSPGGAEIDSFNDHRIAMAFTIAAACVGETVITDAECVSKTYPQFWRAVSSLGVRVSLIE